MISYKHLFLFLLYWVTACTGNLSLAGTVQFQITSSQGTFTLVANGDESAFSPQLFIFNIDGSWSALRSKTETNHLAPGSTTHFHPIELNPKRWHPATILFISFKDKANTYLSQIAILQPLSHAASCSIVWRNERALASPIRDLQGTWIIKKGVSPVTANFINWSDFKTPQSNVVIDLDIEPTEHVLLLNQTREAEGSKFLAQWIEPENREIFNYRPAWMKLGNWGYIIAMVVLTMAIIFSKRISNDRSS